MQTLSHLPEPARRLSAYVPFSAKMLEVILVSTSVQGYFLKESESSLRVVSEISQRYLRVVSELSQSYLRVVSELSQSSLRVVSELSQCSLRVVSE